MQSTLQPVASSSRVANPGNPGNIGRLLNARRAAEYPLGYGGAAERSAMDRALRLHNATSPSAQSRICSQCCAEAKIEQEYRPGVGRFSVRVCLKCQWRDDVSFLLEEPEIPTGPGAHGLDSTRAYLKERLQAIGKPLTLIAALDPLAKVMQFVNWQRHHHNAFKLVEEGYLVQDGTGTLGAPAYRLADKEGK